MRGLGGWELGLSSLSFLFFSFSFLSFFLPFLPFFFSFLFSGQWLNSGPHALYHCATAPAQSLILYLASQTCTSKVSQDLPLTYSCLLV